MSGVTSLKVLGKKGPTTEQIEAAIAAVPGAETLSRQHVNIAIGMAEGGCVASVCKSFSNACAGDKGRNVPQELQPIVSGLANAIATQMTPKEIGTPACMINTPLTSGPAGASG